MQYLVFSLPQTFQVSCGLFSLQPVALAHLLSCAIYPDVSLSSSDFLELLGSPPSSACTRLLVPLPHCVPAEQVSPTHERHEQSQWSLERYAVSMVQGTLPHEPSLMTQLNIVTEAHYCHTVCYCSQLI